MDGHEGRDPDADAPDLTVAILADLQAGLLDDATAARIRHRARADPEAVRILARLDAVRGDLSRLGTDASSAPEPPADVTARIGAALRSASGAPEHRVARPRLSRTQKAVVGSGMLAVAAAVMIAALLARRSLDLP